MKHTKNLERKELALMLDDQLVREKKELLVSFLMTSPGLVSPKLTPSHRGSIRKRIARINTLLGERNRRGIAKEEIRLK